MSEQPAYRVGANEDPLSDLITDFMRTPDAKLLSDIVHSFIHISTRSGFGTSETATMLRAYLAMGPESPLHFTEEVELQELFAFLGRLKASNFWDDEDVIKFQMMIISDPAKAGILEVFKKHVMYKKIFEGEAADSHVTFRNTYYLDSNGVKSLLSGNLRASQSNLSRSQDNDNNAPPAGLSEPLVEPLDDDPYPTSQRPKGSVLTLSKRHVLDELEDNLSEGFEDPYQVHPEIVFDPEEIEFAKIQAGYEGITYVLGMEVDSGHTIDLDSSFQYLRCFRVDTKCTVILSIGGVDQANSWAKDIIAKPGAWINFAEQLLPQHALYFPVRIKVVARHPGDRDKINLRIMGVYLKSDQCHDLSTKLSNNGPDPTEFGFRRYFTLIQ